MIGAILDGFRRSLASPRMLLMLWSVNFLIALPAAWALTASLQASMGHSLVNEELASGFEMGWYGEFQDEARGLDATFSPDLAGPGAFYANLETWITGGLLELPPLVVALGLGYLLLWIFLQGGIYSRLARPRVGFRPARFLGNGSRYFFRYLRLFAMSGVTYLLVFRISTWAYDKLGDTLRDVPEEKPALLAALGLLGLTVILLAAIQATFAYAKISTVIEERRSMFLALGDGMRILLSRPFQTAALYLLMALLSAAMLLLYGSVAPEAGPSSFTGVVLAFILGQIYLGVRIVLRISLLGGLCSLHPADGTRTHVMSRRG